MTTSSFEELLKSAHYKKLLEQLPENERKEVEKTIKQLLINFDKSLSTILP